MRSGLRVIRILILIGITSFIMVKLFNFYSETGKAMFINTFEKEELNIAPETSLEQVEQFKGKAAQNGEPQETESKEEGNLKDIERITNLNSTDKSSLPETQKSETYFLTYDELKSLQKVSFGDKLFGVMILSKMKRRDIDSILALAGGGITSTEAIELKEVLDKALSPKDVGKVYKRLEKNIEKVRVLSNK